MTLIFQKYMLSAEIISIEFVFWLQWVPFGIIRSHAHVCTRATACPNLARVFPLS